MTDYVALMPFAQRLGVRIDSAGKDEVVGSLDHAEDRTTAGGGMHGGALMALADSVGAVCAFLNLPDGASTSTTSSSTVFLRGVRSGTVTATARRSTSGAPRSPLPSSCATIAAHWSRRPRRPRPSSRE